GAQIWSRGYKYVFGFYSQAPTYSHGGLEIAKQKGYKSLALVNEDTAFPQDVVKGAEAKAKELGMELVFKETYPAKTTDFSVLVQKMKGRNPDIVVGGTYLPDSTSIIRQAKDAGFTAKMFFFTTGPALPEFAENLGPLAENVMGNTEWEPVVKAPGVPEFVKAFKEKYGNEPGYHAAGAYASGQVLEAAVQKAGGLDREKLRDAFATLKIDTVFGPYQVDAEGRQIGKPNFVIQWQGGKRVVVWPKQYANAEAKLPFTWK
ncbi:MAG TPA: amino acid ABC transporter substrate-binding protein, partial [Chloroflexota bacterium]|nr:amino acid ABC transporter substrate-binding protein [Chloroflexota bacterium]